VGITTSSGITKFNRLGRGFSPVLRTVLCDWIKLFFSTNVEICLFIALIGWNPYTTPSSRDYQYGLLSKGKLEQLLMMMDKKHLVNDEAVDLLQRILREQEDDRISLREIQNHAFLKNVVYA